MGSEDAVKYLLGKKLSPKTRNRKGLSPLNLAVDNGHNRVADLLRNYTGK